MKKEEKWKLRIIAITALVVFIVLGSACASGPSNSTTSTRTQQQSVQSEEEKLKSAINNNPNDPKLHWDLAKYYVQQRSNALAAAEYDKMVKIDPTYRLSQEKGWSYSVSSAARFGVKTDETIKINNFSVYFMLGACYFDSSSYENALSAFRSGYEIDITNRANNDRNLQIVYLGLIGTTLDNLRKTGEANTYYTQLSKIADVTDPIASRIGIPRLPDRLAVPNWVKMGMTVAQARGNVPKNVLLPRPDVDNQYFYSIGEDMYILGITPEKGLVEFQMGVDYDVRTAAQTIAQIYGKPYLENNETIRWIILDDNSKNITAIAIIIHNGNYNYLNLRYFFSNNFDN